MFTLLLLLEICGIISMMWMHLILRRWKISVEWWLERHHLIRNKIRWRLTIVISPHQSGFVRNRWHYEIRWLLYRLQCFVVVALTVPWIALLLIYSSRQSLRWIVIWWMDVLFAVPDHVTFDKALCIFYRGYWAFVGIWSLAFDWGKENLFWWTFAQLFSSFV